MRTRPRRCFAIASLAAGVTLAAAGCREAKWEAFYLNAPLVSTAGDAASGRLTVFLSASYQRVFVAASRLAPETAYAITADGNPVAELPTDAAGTGRVAFSPTAPRIDPREQTLAVAAPDGTVVLELADPASGGVTMTEIASLHAFAPGEVFVMTELGADGSRSVALVLAGAEPGVYEVTVEGVPRGPLDATSGPGVVRFASTPGPGELPLDFEPRGAAFEIQRDGQSLFFGFGEARIEGIDWCSENRAVQPLAGAAAGRAEASLTTHTSCSRGFEVSIVDVPMGDYELYVDGIRRATIAVGADETGATEGHVRFEEEEEGLRLDFEPVGVPIEVRQGDALLFSAEPFEA